MNLHPPSILISRRATEVFGERIASIFGGGPPPPLLHPEDEPDGEGRYPAEIAFISRDVTGRSGKTDLSPSLLRFYEVLRASPDLRWVQAHSAGADRPIFPEMRARGVTVTTASGATAGPVAQMAVTGLLMLARRIPELMDAQRRRAWEPLLLGDRVPRDLKGQTAVVVGLGPIGLEIARLLKAVGLHVVGVRRQARPTPPADETVSFDDLPAVWPRAEWVVLACPLKPATRGLVDARVIAALPPGARIVNVARGEVVVEDDLAAALRAGRLGGAYLDVLSTEPPGPDTPFWDLPNVILTPHTAGQTAGFYDAVGEIFLDNLERWRDGRPLCNQMP